MNPDLQALKQLVFVERPDDFADDYREAVAEYERALADLSEKEKAKDIPVVKEWIDYLTFERQRCENQLKANRELDTAGRDKMFATIDVCNHFLSMFDGSAQKALEVSIKQTYDAAKN